MADEMADESPVSALLVTAADASYIEQARRVVLAARGAGQWKGDVMLLHTGVREEDLEWFRRSNVILHAPEPVYTDEEWFSRQKSQRKYPSVVTLRLSLFTPFFKQWRKIVHVDGDVVILGPLNGLLATEGFSAAPDYGATLSAQFLEPHLFKERFPKRYNPHASAFNAGVFSFATAIIGDDSYFRIRTLFDKYYGYCGFAEQSILNIYFYKTWSILPWEYNTYYRYLPKNKLKWAKGCAIIHFPMGRDVTRPWEDGNPFSKIWNGRLLYENSSRKMRVLLKLRFLRVYYYRRFTNILKTNKVFAVRLLPKIKNILNFFR